MKKAKSEKIWKPEQVAQWEKTRKTGAKLFIFRWGLWLTPVQFIAWIIHDYSYNLAGGQRDPFWMLTSMKAFMCALIGCFVMGLTYASIYWVANEECYRKACEVEAKRAAVSNASNTAKN